MKTMIIVLSFILSMYGVECNQVYTKYKIDTNIKSRKGWMRVCRNNKLDIYIDKPLDNNETKIICGCLYKLKKNKERTLTKFVSGGVE